jgi:hypothetical protein
MSVKIIAEDLISEDHFLSATEQAGAFVGQPVPSAGNTGHLYPVMSGDENGEIANVSFSGTVNGGNRLYNATFREEFDAGLAANWSKFSALQTYSEETTIVHTDYSAQKVVCADDGEGIGIYQAFSTGGAGVAYYIYAWVYCNENTTVTIAHSSLTGGSETFAVTALTWTKCLWEVESTGVSAGNLEIYRSAANSDVADYIIIGEVFGIPVYITGFTDETLAIAEDGQFVGGTVTFTSGTNDGLSRVTTAQNDGAITFGGGAVTDLIVPGDTYDFEMRLEDLDFELQLTDSGDLGTAKYKWSKDSGSNFWASEYWVGFNYMQDILPAMGTGGVGGLAVVKSNNGTYVMVYTNADDELACQLSTTLGRTWSAEATIADDDAYFLYQVVILESNRIMALAHLGGGDGSVFFYSDDNGSTWSSKIESSEDIKSFCQLPSGNLIAFHDTDDDIKCFISSDGGVTWGSEITVVSDANQQLEPSVCLAANGNLVCAYETDEDSVGDFEVQGKYSTDNGATWSAAYDIEPWDGCYKMKPYLVTMPDGTIRCYNVTQFNAAPTYALTFIESTNNGVSFSVSVAFPESGTAEYGKIIVNVLNGVILSVGYIDKTNEITFLSYQGRPDNYQSGFKELIVPVNGIKQELVCGINVKWLGQGGVAGDSWTFNADWQYAAKNLIANSREKVWRSDSDNQACNIVIDAGVNKVHYVSGVALFDCNVWDMDFEMNGTDSWATPSVEEDIQTVRYTGTLTDTSYNWFEDSAANYTDRELVGLYFMPTAGAESGNAFKIVDNVNNWIRIEGTGNIGTVAYRIFSKDIAVTFSEETYRYIRLAIPAQQTYDDYYQVGTMIAGPVLTLTNAWAIGYQKSYDDGVSMVRSVDGGIVPIRQRDGKRMWNVSWNGIEETSDELRYLYTYIRGRNIALIPDDSNMAEVYLCKMIGPIQKKQWFQNKWNISVTFEEV